jgi:hypothetical protein
VLLGIVPFGVITGVAMVASGIPPHGRLGAAPRIPGAGAPHPLRLYFADAPLRWRLAIAYLTADNVYGLMLTRFSEHPDDPGGVAPGIRRPRLPSSRSRSPSCASAAPLPPHSPPGSPSSSPTTCACG